MKDCVHREPTLRFSILANIAALTILSVCFWRLFGGSIVIYTLVNAVFLFVSNAIWQARVEGALLRCMVSECTRGFFRTLLSKLWGRRNAQRKTGPDFDAAVHDVVKKSSRSLCILPLLRMLLAYCSTGFSKDAYRTALFAASTLHLLTALAGRGLASLGYLVPLPLSRADARDGDGI